MARPTIEESKGLDRAAREALRLYTTTDMTRAGLATELGVSIPALDRLLARGRRNREPEVIGTPEAAEELDRRQRAIMVVQERIQARIDGALGECKRTIDEQARQIAGLKKDGWSEW